MRIRPRVSPRLAPPALVTRPRRPPRPRTSEFWYDGEEEEFDGVAADVRAKTVVLLPVNDGDDSSWIDQARSKLADRAFDACFCSSAALPAATRVWAGRDGPPFFLKPRVRPALDGDDVDAWWSEVAGQNWRLELSHGLAGADPDRPETLLAVAAPRVVAAAAAAAGAACDADGTAHVSFRAWRSEDGEAQLPAWQELVER